MKQLKTFILVFIIWTVVGQIGKLFFLLTYSSLIGEAGFTDCLGIFYHGIILDFAISGYICMLVGLMLIANIWYQGRYLRWVWKGYFALMSFLTAIAYVANLLLYGYWGYPLDNASVFYIKTSPGDAMASAKWWQIIIVIIAVSVITALLTWIFAKAYPKRVEGGNQVAESGKSKIGFSIALLLLTAAMIIPIRGGFGTGTNHTGTVYFSDNIRLNHAAVNPVFSFFESVNNQEDIADMYRFMDDKEAKVIADSLQCTQLRNDSIEYLTTDRPNIVIIMLESFSKYIMDEGGHEKGVTPNLDRLTKEGIYFDNFYASSVRTDRAMVSILSGLPAQPTISIMDMPHKSTSLPSIARTLSKYGYNTSFFYGGDTNYSNMNSYFMGTGYQHVVEEYDFPIELRTSKWGVADGPVYNRMFDAIKEFEGSKGFSQSSSAGGSNSSKVAPFLMTMMTESSHEPFDVPYKSRFKEEELNAFAYADHCLGEFITKLKKLPCWKNTLVIIVPDHLGAWPRNVDNYALWRYQQPMIFMGGAVLRKMNVNTLGSQIDIAATLLGMLHIDHSDFTYSKDVMDREITHFAFFTVDDAMGMVTDDGSVIHDNISNKVVESSGKSTETILKRSKAYLQRVFDDINAR